MSGLDSDLCTGAEAVAARLAGRTLACAESCTAGLVTQTFASVKGSGEWFRGGVVAYQRDSKADVLGVDPSAPLVSTTVAEQMVRGVARAMVADVAVSTTGAAGPSGLDGAPPGTVVVATYIGGDVACFELHYDDATPEDVVHKASRDAIAALAAALQRDDKAVRAG